MTLSSYVLQSGMNCCTNLFQILCRPLPKPKHPAPGVTQIPKPHSRKNTVLQKMSRWVPWYFLSKWASRRSRGEGLYEMALVIFKMDCLIWAFRKRETNIGWVWNFSSQGPRVISWRSNLSKWLRPKTIAQEGYLKSLPSIPIWVSLLKLFCRSSKEHEGVQDLQWGWWVLAMQRVYNILFFG